MKALILTTALLGIAAATAFSDTKNELDNHVRELMAKFDSLQANPHARIPASKLKKARGVLIMDRDKGGLVFGYEKGSGIALIKEQGKWSPLSFMTSNETSFGVQLGGKNTFCVILLMNHAARDRLLRAEESFGGEAWGIGGSHSAGKKKNFTKQPGVLVYAQSKGIYGGAVLKGGSLESDNNANQAYYGQIYSIKDILFDKRVAPSDTATEFARKLDSAANDK